MIQANPNRIRLVSISAEEKQTLLKHSKHIDESILTSVSSSTSGQFTLFPEEFDRFLMSLNCEASTADSHELQTIFAKLHQRLCQQFSDDPPHRRLRPHDVISQLIANSDFSSLEELNDILQSVQKQQNQAPDPEMGDLSPEQVAGLIYSHWRDSACPITFNKTLSLDELQAATFFHNARLLLNTLLEFGGEESATVRGNLNRKIVKVLFERMSLDDDYRASIIRYNKVINETDVGPLHVVKTVCEAAHLIHHRQKKILLTKKHRGLLANEKSGELYYLLFEAYFRSFNIGYSDRLPDLDGVQETIAYSLYRISTLCSDYCSTKALFQKALLPAVRQEIEDCIGATRERPWVVETRIIKPLEEFGLLECKRGKGNYRDFIVAARKTKLFDRFIKFRL